MAAGAALVVFAGEYDLSCEEQWRNELQRLCREPNLIIDLQNVTYLDVTCATELMRMHERRDANGFGREIVILGQPIVRRLFDLLSLRLLFRIVDSSDDAARERREATVVRHAFRRFQHFDSLEGPLPATF